MSTRWAAFLAALTAFGLVLAGCGGDDGSAPNETEHGANPPEPSIRGRLIESVPARCTVGERPDYFVPHPPDRRLTLLGCARLGVSGKKVEFSGHLARIGGELHVCLDPAPQRSGQRGLFIPGMCLGAPLSRFAIRHADQPRQGVRGYAFVIWGTAGAMTSDVVARFKAGAARAAVFKVPSEFAASLGQPPFGLFVVELPLAAACAPVTVRRDRSAAIERIPRRPELCRRA